MNIFTTIVNSCIALNPERYFDVSYLEKEILRILNGETAEFQNIYIAFHNLGWNTEHWYHIAILAGSDIRSVSEKLAALAQLPERPCYLIPYYDTPEHKKHSGPEKMIILCNIFKNNTIIKKLETIVASTKGDLYLGISMPFYQLEEMKLYYEQAQFALQYAEKHHMKHIRCEYIIPEALSEILKEDSSLHMLIHPDISILMKHDRDYQTDYLNTFRAFLYHGCSYQATARAMSLHQNTLRYRMRKIESLISGNLYDAQYRESMLCALLLV